MTIDQLVDLSAAEWAQVSEQELKLYLEPYLTVTRPVPKKDLSAAPKDKQLQFKSMSSARRNEVIAQALALEKKIKEMNNK